MLRSAEEILGIIEESISEHRRTLSALVSEGSGGGGASWVERVIIDTLTEITKKAVVEEDEQPAWVRYLMQYHQPHIWAKVENDPPLWECRACARPHFKEGRDFAEGTEQKTDYDAWNAELTAWYKRNGLNGLES